ncbi:MAG: adenosylcobyric acid synthase [Actinomycetota bacterium]|jgi:adenosylcobyric acid synthase
MRGALMVCGTTSDAGKSHVTAGLCRVLHRRGVRVAPFKAQNMSLNSYVTSTGHEIGRAQAVQAMAAGVEPEVAMNPILLKPTSETDCQMVVMGRPVAHLDAFKYHDTKLALLPTVLDALADLRQRFDVVILEGAGSPAEINLADRDIVNLPIAVAAGIKAIVIGDIERGGVFAALYGTVELLPPEQRAAVGGFLINKFRGDPALLLDGPDELARRTGIPVLGVLPYVTDVALDAEDSLSFNGPLPRPGRAAPTVLDVVGIRWPHLANATDLDPVAIEPGVGLRWVDHAASLGRPDLVVLPGSKATVTDLNWLRGTGLDRAIAATDAAVLGICGGYQALGRTIRDLDGVEAAADTMVDGLGWLDVDTEFRAAKHVAQCRGIAMGASVTGYQIHHGRTRRASGTDSWVALDGEAEGEGGSAPGPRFVLGTSLHGIFESDAFRRMFLTEVARRRGITFRPAATSFAAARERQLDRLGDLVENHVDLATLSRLIEASL